MKRMGLFLLAIVFFCGFFTEVFAGEEHSVSLHGTNVDVVTYSCNSGDTKIDFIKIDTPINIDAPSNILPEDSGENDRNDKFISRIRTLPRACVYKLLESNDTVHVHKNGQVKLEKKNFREVWVMMPCPEERVAK